MSGPLDDAGLRRVFAADGWWGLAAFLWISTGLWRLLAGTEKATSYYLQNHVFIGKMTLLAMVLVLELWPMAALIRWRRLIAKGERPDTRSAPRYARHQLRAGWADRAHGVGGNGDGPRVRCLATP